MSEQQRRREAQVFARHLFRMECPEAVVESYARFHGLHPARLSSDGNWFDRLLMKMGRQRLLLAVADSYAALFRPHSILRRRLVLCLALLECRPECDQALQRSHSAGRFQIGLELSLALLVQVCVTMVAVVILGPVDLVIRLYDFLNVGQSKERSHVR
jgi:hypothetical protein